MKATPTLPSTIQRLFWRGIALMAFALVLWPSSDLKASHIVGGDITYKCLGNNKYEITLNVYRDCFYGDPLAWFDNPAYVGIYRKSNNTLFQQVNMYFSGVNDTLSNFITDTCLFVPPAVCVHATQYKKIVTIPYDPAGYEIAYMRCCRNETVQNIIDPLHTGATFCITLSGPAMQQCNSSPSFGSVAPIFICVNQPLNYNHSAIDPDGDSLVYRLNTPLVGGTYTNAQPIPPPVLPPLQNVQWLDPPYSEDNMLGASIPLEIDPHTGILTAFPTIQGQFVVGVAVEEYRNGVLLSTVRRDFQYNIGECGEVISSFFIPDAQCDDLSVDFQNLSTFADAFIWYFDWGGDLSLTSTATNPTFVYPDTGWYTIALIAEPASQCVDTSYKQIYLQYNSLFAGFEFTVFDCVDTTVLQITDMSFDTISPIISWNWEITYSDTVILTSTVENPIFQIPRGVTGTITLTALSLNGCEQSISEPFVTGTDEFPVSLIPDTQSICLGDSAVLNPQANNILYPFYWEPDSLFADPMLPNQTVSPGSNTTYTVYITAVDSLCYAQTDINVIVEPLPELAFDFEVDCNGRTVNFTNNSINSASYFWNFGDLSTTGDTSSLVNPIYSYPDTGTYIITLTTGANALCKDTISQELVLQNTILEAAFTYELNDCEVDSVVVYFTDQSQNGLNNTIGWEWEFDGLGSSDQQNPTLTVFQSDTILVHYTITTGDNCQDSITQEIIVLLPEDQFIVDSIVICPGNSAELNPGGNPDLVYLWSPSDGLSDPTAANPVATPSETTTYTVTVSVPDFTTCFITREVKVTVPPALNLMSSGDVTTCDPQVTLTASIDAPATITWVSNPGNNMWTGDEITVDVTGVTTYTITAADAFGCSEETSLTVQGGPVDYALSADSIIICSDEPFDVFVTNLDPNDVLIYQWDPNPAIVSGGNTNNPVISNEPGQTVLYVNMTNQFDCVANDSVYLAIVDSNIQLDFDYEIIDCDGLTVQFNNLSQFAYDFVWDFGDPSNPGAVSFEDNPTYTYPAIGTYLVTLNILYDAACVEPVTKPVELLEPILDADFRYFFTACDEDSITIEFNDLSYNFLNNTTNWDWTFSNGGTSTQQNPVITVTENQVLTATLVITTAFDCTDTASFEIPIELTVVDLADTIILCYGDTTAINPLGNPNYQYNWSPAIGLSDPTAVNPDVFATETTTYTVDVTNFTGDTCQITRSITVIVPELITLDANGGLAIACNEPITLDVVANVSPLVFTWTNTAGDVIGTGDMLVVFPTNTTTYYVEGVDQYGCSGRDTVIVTVPTQIEVAIEGEFVSCQTTVDLTAFTNADPAIFQWFANGTPFGGNTNMVSVDPGISTLYTVIATDTFGCQATADSLVTVPEAINMEVTDDQVSCQTAVTLSAIANVPLNYVWTSNNMVVDTVATITVQPGETVWYYITGTDSLGCFREDSVLVTVPPPIEVAIEGDFVSCQATVDLTALTTVAPVTFQWFADGVPFGGNTGTVSVDPGISTLYTVIATDTFGCQATADSLVTVPDAIIMEVTDDQVSCQTAVNLSATANVPLNYVWTSNNVVVDTVANITVQPGTTSWYYITGTDSLGCFREDSVLVTVPPPVNVSVEGDMVSCQQEITLEAVSTISPVTYEWFVNGNPIGDGSNTLTVNPGLTTDYVVVVTDTFGCQATDTALVVVPSQIVLTVSEDQISCQTEVELTASGNVTLTYQWWVNSMQVGDSSVILVNPDTTTLYYVLVTDSLGCQAAETVLVTVPETIEMLITPDTTACEGPIMLTATANVPLGYEWWTGGSDPVSGSQITVLPDTTGWYYVLGTDNFGCEALDSVFVTNGIVDIQADGQIIVCPVDSMTLEVTNTDPFDMLSYVWSAGAGGTILSDDTLSLITVSTIPGSVEFYVTATNQFGCSFTDTVEVLMSDFEPTFNDTVHVCSGIPTEINPGANPNYTYNWEPQIGGIDPTSPNPTVTLTQSQTYTVTITDFAGVDTCAAILEVTVLVNPDIQLDAQGDTTLCEFVPTLLTATTGVTPANLSWYDDPALSNMIGDGSQIVVNPVGNTIYYVVAQDMLGCLDTATVEINAFPIDISTIPQYDLCIGEELVIGVINNAQDQDLTYVWSPGNSIVEGGTTPTPTVNPNLSTTYTVIVENQYGCVDSASTFVNVIDVISSLFATADPDTILYKSGMTSQLETIFNNDYTYWWWPDGSLITSNTIYNPVAEPDSTTTYYIEIEGEAGCRGLDSVTVVVLDPPCEPPYIFVPTAFTPNGDGENDTLFVRGNTIDVVYFAVYSRWGQKVFETTDLNVGWDGTFKGEALPPDVFGWYLSVECFNGDKFFDKGNVTLLR
ncbi:MAG: gliding motility-associated C-terminal domain-containing protein [Saprospirales bacterium]|nr:gliding motility-associated C-terminal domain-containing protein [Saprospirales bacterium]